MLCVDPQRVPIWIGEPPVEDFELAVPFADQVTAFGFGRLTTQHEVCRHDQEITVGVLHLDHMAIVDL